MSTTAKAKAVGRAVLAPANCLRAQPPDLRERAQPADAHLQQRVLASACRRARRGRTARAAPRAQRRAQIDLVIAEQARAQPAVGGEPHAVAATRSTCASSA